MKPTPTPPNQGEKDFLKERITRLRKEYCWICGEEMKPYIHGEGVTWVCKKDKTKATDFLPDILEKNRCGQCGVEIKLSPKLQKEQIASILRGVNYFACDNCIAKNHTVTDQELVNIKTK